MLILVHPKGATLTKTFAQEDTGLVAKSIEFPTLFEFAVIELSNLEQLSSWLQDIETRHEFMVVRGVPIDDQHKGLINRRSAGVSAHLKASPQQWLCVDIDDLPIPEGYEAGPGCLAPKFWATF